MTENHTPDSTNQTTTDETHLKPLNDMKNKAWKEFKSIVIIILCVFTFRSVFFEPFKIPSGSMIPTLMIGDFIVVNKFSYGFKVPFSDFTWGDTSWDPIYLFGKKFPERGDVVVFKYPRALTDNYIKRVIGLPGDTIEIRNKVVYINDQPLEGVEFDGAEIMKDMDDKFKDIDFKFYKMKTGNHEHTIQVDSADYRNMDMPKVTIPADNFFVMGDNRDNSYDSRGWGFVDFKLIRGKAMFVWFSMIFPGGEDSFKFRPWRIGKAIN